MFSLLDPRKYSFHQKIENYINLWDENKFLSQLNSLVRSSWEIQLFFCDFALQKILRQLIFDLRALLNQ